MTEQLAISLSDVWVEYQLRHAHHYNLKRSISNVLARRHEEAEIISALRGISLSVPRGSRIGLTGPNGSGKSTLLAVMAGVLVPTQGSCEIHGRVLALLGGPNEGLDPEQTGRENAVMLGVRLGESIGDMRDRCEEIREFSGLGPRFEHPTYTYSSGMQMRLRFTTVTSLRADVLLVDEGIGMADSEFNLRAGQRLVDFYGTAGTLILASHNESIVAEHCQQVVRLTNGRIDAIEGFAP
jgi:ABC-type polysaccharide/polyol phosphate transport system ATPase subunit